MTANKFGFGIGFRPGHGKLNRKNSMSVPTINIQEASESVEENQSGENNNNSSSSIKILGYSPKNSEISENLGKKSKSYATGDFIRKSVKNSRTISSQNKITSIDDDDIDSLINFVGKSPKMLKEKRKIDLFLDQSYEFRQKLEEKGQLESIDNRKQRTTYSPRKENRSLRDIHVTAPGSLSNTPSNKKQYLRKRENNNCPTSMTPNSRPRSVNVNYYDPVTSRNTISEDRVSNNLKNSARSTISVTKLDTISENFLKKSLLKESKSPLNFSTGDLLWLRLGFWVLSFFFFF